MKKTLNIDLQKMIKNKFHTPELKLSLAHEL